MKRIKEAREKQIISELTKSDITPQKVTVPSS